MMMVFDQSMSQGLGIRKSDQVEDTDDEDGGLEFKAANLIDALRAAPFLLSENPTVFQ